MPAQSTQIAFGPPQTSLTSLPSLSMQVYQGFSFVKQMATQI